MEALLLRERAARLGLGDRWFAGLGHALAEIRALLPPAALSEFVSWDPQPLLRRLEAAVGHLARAPRRGPPRADLGPCALVGMGRVAAARAALRGEPPAAGLVTSDTLKDKLQELHVRPPPDSVLGNDEWNALAEDVAAQIESLPETKRVSEAELLARAHRSRGSAAVSAPGAPVKQSSRRIADVSGTASQS